LRKGIVWGLEAALAISVLLCCAGIILPQAENPFYKNAAFSLAVDAAYSGFAPAQIGGYCLAGEPCAQNCVKASKTVFDGESFGDEDSFACWNE
jgi:hypothetical protein